MLFAVHHQAVVNLIGENDELMLPCNVHDLLQNLAGIQRSGRVVGIDDNDRFRAVGYFLLISSISGYQSDCSSQM